MWSVVPVHSVVSAMPNNGASSCFLSLLAAADPGYPPTVTKGLQSQQGCDLGCVVVLSSNPLLVIPS